MKIRMLKGPNAGKIVDPCTRQAEQWVADRLAEPVPATTFHAGGYQDLGPLKVVKLHGREVVVPATGMPRGRRS